MRALKGVGFEVFWANTGRSGAELALSKKPDLVILDIMLPEMDGWEVCKAIREKSVVPILMLTALSEEVDRILGLELGADDYMTKPFSTRELLARVKALLRRATMRDEATLLRVGELTVNPLTRDVTRGGRAIALTQKEYALLEYLVRHAGMPVTREQISEQVWKQPFDPTTNIVDVYINYLRKKIDQDADKPLVHTVRGVGYMLKAD